jgi:hypothetical protein
MSEMAAIIRLHGSGRSCGTEPAKKNRVLNISHNKILHGVRSVHVRSQRGSTWSAAVGIAGNESSAWRLPYHFGADTYMYSTYEVKTKIWRASLFICRSHVTIFPPFKCTDFMKCVAALPITINVYNIHTLQKLHSNSGGCTYRSL